ncbi:HI0074 family nucleotidyltransferase substrate-binding subunit [Bacillus sp. 165]|uniref:HI0074 family nucleotidyltransferase substrate-binding subunit n=1 Tax=Bacillus sp. 165 TaxID=1529117 RepID=UPI001ADD2E62|nr:HI0074 family nucleotidyltransferase substrate-binding subunit [Bacillus sp. 165]MBO9130928.1 nucleotidyltransferase substrate binding protein [Bacillus sp. 165]
MLDQLQSRLEDYEKALKRLDQAIHLPLEESIVVDGIIQRFVFTYELARKLMKAFLEYEGIINIHTPRLIFKESCTALHLDNMDHWLSMIVDRNMAQHAYDEDVAMPICERIKLQYMQALSQLLIVMKQKLTI